MGLKYASVRQPHVVVMAPALTETGQPQGFPLKSVNLSSPVSPVTLKENSENTLKFKCTKRLKFVETTVGMNGDSENVSQLKPTQDKTIESLKPNSVDSALKNKIVLNSSGTSEQSVAKEPDYSLLQIGGFMMNNSYPAPGDTDNMGLPKTDSLATMDSILKGLSSNAVAQNDLGGAGDLGHNVEEIMQVIKNMESKSSDLEVNLDSGLPISDSNDIAGGLSTFERELLNDVDIMNKLMCVDENLSENNLAAINKDSVIKEKVDEALERQFKIERKCQWLMRRLRKMQARAMGKQASEEINGLLQHVSNILEDSHSPNRPSTLYSALTSGKDDTEKSRPGCSNISTFIRRLEQTAQQQALSSSQHHVPCKYFGSGSVQNANSKLASPTLSGSILPKLSGEVWNEVDRVSGQLGFQLKTVETAIDSDATASSSGGESCDEMQNFSNPHHQTLPILKRASWRWSKERAAIGSRWAWLQTQISDLEYRIRQNNDLNKQIRTAKGGVVMGGEDPPRLCDSVVVNGYHGAVPGKSADDEVVSENTCRTRPLTRTVFRKRKLLRTAGLHLTSKKAAKPSTVPCGCLPPLPTCALCTGRPDPRTEFEDVDLMTLNERVAVLDPAFHPVLSLPSDMSQSVHFDAIMKTSDWQLKAQRGQMKTAHLVRTVELTEDVEVEASAKQRPLLEQPKRRYIRRNLGLTPNLSDKLKRKLAKVKRLKLLGDPNLALGRLKKRRRFSSLKEPGVEDGVCSGSAGREEDEVTDHPSPAPSPTPHSTPHCSKERGDGLRRKRENSYDIDNIVIPYSVAASTRLEKLQYKEILTPKWRVLALDPLPKIEPKNNNGLIRRPSQEEEGENEDMTEELLVNRHERCEQEERKKFSTYLKLPNSMARPRGHRRADSRAESSGGNTPDPMSPAAADAGNSNGGAETPLTSPPATPQPADLECPSRRRTISSRCVSPVEGVLVEVPPYEPRTFPLTDETYEKMLRVMPPGHPYKVYSSSHHNYSHDSECGSRPTTPISDSTESAETYMEDDPNDPEWTVDETSMDKR